MSAKIKSAVLSAMSLILIIIGFMQMKADNYKAAIVLIVIGIILAAAYFIVSVPDFIRDLKKRK